MKKNRTIAVFLVICMILCLPSYPLRAQETTQKQEILRQESELQPEARGNLDLMILLNYKAKPEELRLSLQSDTESILNGVRLSDLAKQNDVSKETSFSVELSNREGQETGFTDFCALANVSIKQIPIGEYDLTLSGNGYKTYTAKVTLDTYSKRIIVANDNKSFTAGDLNKDGEVDQEDLKLLKSNLSTQKESYDLNGDKLVDLSDYAYLYNNIYANGKEMISNTALIPESAFSLSSILPENASGLFSSNQINPIDLKSTNGGKISEENPVTIQVPFLNTAKAEIQYVQMLLPSEGTTAPLEGVIEYEYEENGNTKTETASFSNGNIQSQSLNNSIGVNTLEAAVPVRTIVVDLGKRVAVKKITIKITKTQGDTTLASIGNVTFLQELETTIQDEVNRVNHVTATPSDKAVSLTWGNLQNVSGYLVKYGTASGVYTKSLSVTKNQVKIEGLENDTTYYFVVCGTNGTWEGTPSFEVSATPVEASAPGKVGGLAVEPGDKQIHITWSAMKNAVSYNLYYKEQNSTKPYEKITGIVGTAYTLTDLVNKTPYVFAVSAVNAYGEGEKSAEALGIPDEIIVKEPEGIPTHQLISRQHITSIRLSNPDHYDKTIYPNGFNPNAVIDGDYTTHWTARGNWWENQGFVVTFDQAYDMDHMVWVTRLDQNAYKTANDRYYVEVWGESDDLTKGGTILADVGSKIIKNPLSKDGVEVLTFQKSNVKQIRISVKIWDGARVLPSASELRFYEYYSIVDDVTALFQNDLHTTLANGVTKAKIDELRNRINGNTGEFYVEKTMLLKELDLAESLLTASVGNVITLEKGRNASSDSDRNFSFSLSELQPLGVVQNAGDSLIVYVETEGNTLPTLIATQNAGEASAWSESISLKKGRNIITPKKIGASATQRGGSLYITYRGQEDAKVNILGGTKIPILNLSDFSFEDIAVSEGQVIDAKKEQNKAAIKAYIQAVLTYEKTIPNNNTIQSNIANATEVATKHVLLSIPLKAVTSGLSSKQSVDEKTDALYEALVAWEENMRLHYTVCGLSKDAEQSRDRYPSSRINIRYMTMTGKAFMYAGGAHIGIDYPSSTGMIAVSLPAEGKENGFFGWGINHEIGHVLDQKGLVEGETTNNIHSLYSQTYDYNKNTGTSRLEGGIYDSVYDKVSIGMPGKSNNVFVQLVMYWQLHLMYDDEAGNGSDFYSRLYRLNREKTVTANSQDMLFVKLACDTAQRDLTEFFTRWGYVLDADTINYIGKYPKEDRPVYYVNDSVRRYRLNHDNGTLFGSGGVVSEISVIAKQLKEQDKFDSSVEIKITLPEAVTDSNRDRVLGYEIKRNNQVIAYIPAESEQTNEILYVDEGFVMNNVILNYEVTAYDMDFNAMTGTADPIQLRYDGAMDNKDFNYEVSDQGVVIDLKAQQEISGIRIQVPTQSSLRTVTGVALRDQTSIEGTVIKGETKIEVTLSKAEVEEDGALIYYFNAPNNNVPDGRIWTYGADKLILKLDTSDSNIDWKSILTTVRYPGDMIEFYNSQSSDQMNAIGKLSADYRYGENPEDVIKAGSLVVVGNYRGDPVYNAVKLYGKYSALPQEGDDLAESELKDGILLEGEQFLFAEVPEDKLMTNISNGLWIYVLNASDSEKLPDTIRAELYRVDNPDTLENERLVSNTMEISVPTWETLPTIELQQQIMSIQEEGVQE